MSAGDDEVRAARAHLITLLFGLMAAQVVATAARFALADHLAGGPAAGVLDERAGEASTG